MTNIQNTQIYNIQLPIHIYISETNTTLIQKTNDCLKLTFVESFKIVKLKNNIS